MTRTVGIGEIAMDISCFVTACRSALLACTLIVATTPAFAQDPIASFYRGKTITIGVGFTAGGGYDLHARTLARHLGRHVPGNPNIVVKNVPGAAGLTLVNALANTAPKDGTEIATFDRAIPLEPLVSPERARFDALKLNWIGSTDNDVSTCFAWHTARVKTLDDLLKHELVVGGTGTGGNATIYPRLLNAVLGTRFKIVPGYPGSTEVLLAIERGESEGFCSMGFVTLEYTKPHWVRDRSVNVLVQLGITKNKDHLDVPLALDLAKTPEDRQAIELVVSPNLFARPFTAPPDVPPERVRALRQAFNATLADPDYLAEAAARKMQVVLVKGEEIDAVLKRIYSMPRSVMDRVKEAIK
jgi:tripartite-type tricarboxylate transporter receptor subunit TctC